MLVEFAYWLQSTFPGLDFLRVFQYLTFRAVMAALTALIIGLWISPYTITWLISLKVGQPIRSYGMQTHLSKYGTPTMGGVIILTAIIVATFLWFDLKNRFVWIVLFVTIGHGILGWIDDWIKVVNKNPEGMRSRVKFFWQSAIAIIAAFLLVFAVGAQSNKEMLSLMSSWIMSGFTEDLPAQTNLLLPFIKQISYPLGVAGFVILTYLVIVGTSNAVNLTDGLDGLAIMPVVLIGMCLGIFAYVTGNAVFSQYLHFPFIKDTGEVMIFCTAVVGAGFAFLWYNAHPAQIFMGDVGSLALGAALGTVAVVVRQELVFFIMSGIFVAEALSVMIQVVYFKVTKKIYGSGRRVFLMAPLHHHFERKGWKETQVVIRFWIITFLLCLLALTTLKLR